MSSVNRGLAQPLSKSLILRAATNVYSLSSLATQLAAVSAVQVGSVFVAPTAASINTALGAASPVSTGATGNTVTDLGKTITIEVSGATDGACVVRLREVKHQTATSAFTTGYVVVENNYQLSNALVTVGRA